MILKLIFVRKQPNKDYFLKIDLQKYLPKDLKYLNIRFYLVSINENIFFTNFIEKNNR